MRLGLGVSALLGCWAMLASRPLAPSEVGGGHLGLQVEQASLVSAWTGGVRWAGGVMEGGRGKGVGP